MQQAAVQELEGAAADLLRIAEQLKAVQMGESNSNGNLMRSVERQLAAMCDMRTRLSLFSQDIARYERAAKRSRKLS
jgi:hypothetical protein